MGKVNRVQRQMRSSPRDRNRAEAQVAISEAAAVTSERVRVRVQATLPRAPARALETWLLFILWTPPERLGKVELLPARTLLWVRQKGRGRSSKVLVRC